ncbi:hypothetical protein DOY81_008289 [Sarcophaga bullata]|nr:hypothetical protein DOY81_008289 [Sarcophaga bullata]
MKTLLVKTDLYYANKIDEPIPSTELSKIPQEQKIAKHLSHKQTKHVM